VHIGQLDPPPEALGAESEQRRRRSRRSDYGTIEDRQIPDAAFAEPTDFIEPAVPPAIEHSRRHGRHQHPIGCRQNGRHLLARDGRQQLGSTTLDTVEVGRVSSADDERPITVEAAGHHHGFIQRGRRFPAINSLETTIGGHRDSVAPPLEKLLRGVDDPTPRLCCRTRRGAQEERQTDDKGG